MRKFILQPESIQESLGAEISKPFRLGKQSFVQKRVSKFGISIRLKKKLGVTAS
jgi:hypothetical protein